MGQCISGKVGRENTASRRYFLPWLLPIGKQLMGLHIMRGKTGSYNQHLQCGSKFFPLRMNKLLRTNDNARIRVAPGLRRKRDKSIRASLNLSEKRLSSSPTDSAIHLTSAVQGMTSGLKRWIGVFTV